MHRTDRHQLALYAKCFREDANIQLSAIHKSYMIVVEEPNLDFYLLLDTLDAFRLPRMLLYSSLSVEDLVR